VNRRVSETEQAGGQDSYGYLGYSLQSLRLKVEVTRRQGSIYRYPSIRMHTG
jgi:hypothetical protein